jgi:hypothetical protein
MDGWGILQIVAKENHSALWLILGAFVSAALNPRVFCAVSAAITVVFILTH